MSEKKITFTSSIMDMKPGTVYQRPGVHVAYKILKRDFISPNGTAYYTATEVPKEKA
jgi:hypothetical protein